VPRDRRAIGAMSFGGGITGWVYRDVVLRRQWMTEAEFITGLSLAQTPPGGNVTNVSVYVGNRLRGIPGVLVAPSPSDPRQAGPQTSCRRAVTLSASQNPLVAGESMAPRRVTRPTGENVPESSRSRMRSVPERTWVSAGRWARTPIRSVLARTATLVMGELVMT
jgi:hypothetical protein